MVEPPSERGLDAGEVTRLLHEVCEKTPGAVDQLVEVVRDELRRRAEHHLAGAPPWRTLNPTDLVHETYLRLFHAGDPSWQDRGHFFMAASRAMHDIIVERARRAEAKKRGGGWQRVPLQAAHSTETEPVDPLALDEALTMLEDRWPRRAHIVRLRFYGGLTEQEIANALQSSPATIRREWASAKAWLLSKLGHDPGESER